ncbi:hypothetical protein GH714_024843 [Hevea brasiliensis]|uniref:WPP domain-containing protein n=1 Tax=Hevea brasiliensis TaxID=3981 RepID=A0A6A6NJW5_HEVBR|nr:hypothetical protein GH714_024843 [Hevea brasiliensis]
MQKYGVLSKEEAEEDAKTIEESAFAAADQHYQKEPDGDGSSAVQVYAKESSKLMLEVLKRGPRMKEDGEAAAAEKSAAVHADLFDISGGRRAFIKPILSSIKDQLTEVDLSDFVAGRPEPEALEVMNIFSSALEGCNLRYLNLSNNALGEKGVRAFGSLLKTQNNLEELYLINDGISEEAARAVYELIPSTEKLKVLQFHNNMTGDEGAIAIADIVKLSTMLEDFRCSSTRIGSDGGVVLAGALGKCSHLRKLDLRDNMFGVEAGLALSKSLVAFGDLTEVYLSYLNLEDDGAEALANALKESAPSLEVLEMAGNDITAKGASSLADCIAAKQFLSKLNLSENELKDEGAILIAKAIESGHGQLSEVDLSSNSIRRAGARLLDRLLCLSLDLSC